MKKAVKQRRRTWRNAKKLTNEELMRVILARGCGDQLPTDSSSKGWNRWGSLPKLGNHIGIAWLTWAVESMHVQWLCAPSQGATIFHRITGMNSWVDACTLGMISNTVTGVRSFFASRYWDEQSGRCMYVTIWRVRAVTSVEHVCSNVFVVLNLIFTELCGLVNAISRSEDGELDWDLVRYENMCLRSYVLLQMTVWSWSVLVLVTYDHLVCSLAVQVNQNCLVRKTKW